LIGSNSGGAVKGASSTNTPSALNLHVISAKEDR
jgi:hypothetical protein